MAKLEDIQKALEQRRQQAPAPAPAPQSPASRPPGARPYVAQAGDALKNNLIEQNRQYKAERDGGMVLLRLDPKQVGRTEFANRHALSLSPDDASLQALKASIRRHGQDTPIRVRPALSGSTLPYELVEGHRRHAVCLELDAELEGGFPVLARLDAAAADSRDLVLKMYRENAERADLSPYEYGRMFQSWLDGGVFASQSDLASHVHLAQPTVSVYLGVAALPSPVIEAFGDPRLIAVRWRQPLAQALKQDREHVLATAAELAATRPALSAEDVFKRLTAPKARPKRDSASHEQTVKIKGKVAFRIARREGRVSIKFAPSIDRGTVKSIAEKLKDVAEELLKEKAP